jgi:hypothetical protein
VILVRAAGWDLHIAVDFHPDLFAGEREGAGVAVGGGRKKEPIKDAMDYKAEYRTEMERVALIVDMITMNAHLFDPAWAPQPCEARDD